MSDQVNIMRCKHSKICKSHSLGRLTRTLLGTRNGSADVGEDTSFSDGSVMEKFVEFLVVSDGEEDMSGDNSGLLVVLGGVSSEFEDLSSEVFEDGCQVDGSTGTNSFGVMGVSEETSNSAYGELKTSS